MGYATILGLDLGKFKSVCCAMDAATGGHAFETLATTPATVHELLVRHASAGVGVLLVIETCDVAGWVHDLAVALGVTLTVVHTQGDERWRWRKVKRKTDRDDALKLARLARLLAAHAAGADAFAVGANEDGNTAAAAHGVRPLRQSHLFVRVVGQGRSGKAGGGLGVGRVGTIGHVTPPSKV